MKRILVVSIILITMFTLFLNSDELDSQLAKDLLKERRYEAGLTSQGDSGFVITSGTDTLYKGAWMVGVTGFLDRSGDNSPYPEFGVNLAASAGICKDLWGVAYS